MPQVRRADVVDAPIAVEDVRALAADARAGAVVTFSGDVRDHDDGRPVERLEYEGHPTAGAVIAEVAARGGGAARRRRDRGRRTASARCRSATPRWSRQ